MDDGISDNMNCDNLDGNSDLNQNENIDEDINNINGLLKTLNTLNISYRGIVLVLIGVILNLKFVAWSRIGVLDQINNTNYAQNIGDLSEVPRISNVLYLIATTIFVWIIYDQYRTQLLVEPSQMDREAIDDAYNKYTAIILVYLGTVINFYVLNKSE